MLVLPVVHLHQLMILEHELRPARPGLHELLVRLPKDLLLVVAMGHRVVIQ